MISPTSPGAAFELGAKTDDPWAMYLNDYCTVPISLAGLPAISIPNGLAEGLPTGFQIAGPAFSENRILDAAHALEQAIGFDGSKARGMSDYEPVIGLEIHVQLSTRTKMFCGCAVGFGEAPNTRTCPVCLGLPGALPVLNAQAVQYGLTMGLAFDCEIAPRSIFHRKNYFYPDNPKAYQISQYDIPLCLGGHVGEVRLHRIHLEEDAAKLIHLGESGRIHGSSASVVDFNRAGTPLCEIVTEPDLHSAEQAREWLTLLRVTLRQLGVSDVNMEEGSLRCDANVSIRPKGSDELGTKTELKNMNSFRFVMQGINAEIERQTALLEAGEPVRPGDAALRPPQRPPDARCARRRRRTTTATSPSPTWCRSCRPRRCCRPRATRCPSCRPSAPSATSATGRCRPRPRGCSRPGRSSATTSRRPRPPRPRASSRR